MKKLMLTAMAGLTVGLMSASATMILDQSQSLSGTTYVVDDPGAATFVNNGSTRVRWTSTPQTGTGTTASTTDTNSDDYYWSLGGTNLVSGGSAIPTTAAYVKIDFTLTGGWVVDSKADQIFRKTELTATSGSTTPTDQTNLPWDTTVGTIVADGSYSVIVDLTPAPDAGTEWTLLRWDFFNGNPANTAPFPNAGGKTFTVDAVTYATSVIPEPATMGLFAAFGGAILFMRRRFRV